MTHQQLGRVFGSPTVAEAYEHRPPYPAEVFDRLERLIVDEPRVVLDIGAGEGAIARPFTSRVDRVDAVDISAAMIDAGRQRPGGQQPNLRWIVDSVETAELDGPYALVTAGASLHWMQWDVTLDRLAQVVTAHGQLAIVEHGPRDLPWNDDLLTVIKRHSRNPNFVPDFSLVEALRERGLFEPAGSAETAPVVFRQSVADYIEQFHSTSSLARDHMSEQENHEFDVAVEAAVRPWAVEGVVELKIVANLSWGRPLRRQP